MTVFLIRYVTGAAVKSMICTSFAMKPLRFNLGKFSNFLSLTFLLHTNCAPQFQSREVGNGRKGRLCVIP